jgi:hypothetical protein
MEFVAAVIVTAMCAALGLLAMRSVCAGAEVVMLMFRSPADLGWPSGVQEDDDLHWRWSGLPAAAAEDGDGARVALRSPAAAPIDDPPARPEIVDLPHGTGPRTSPVARS